VGPLSVSGYLMPIVSPGCPAGHVPDFSKFPFQLLWGQLCAHILRARPLLVRARKSVTPHRSANSAEPARRKADPAVLGHARQTTVKSASPVRKTGDNGGMARTRTACVSRVRPNECSHDENRNVQDDPAILDEVCHSNIYCSNPPSGPRVLRPKLGFDVKQFTCF
jgi:hypothetical protein